MCRGRCQSRIRESSSAARAKRRRFSQQGLDFVKEKLDVLREHCEREGRIYDDIEKTIYYIMNPGPNGENAGQMIDQLGRFAEAGVQTAIGAVTGVENLTPLEAMGRDVIPQVARL